MSPLVAGKEPAKSATDAYSREAPFSSWLGRLFTHRFSRRAAFCSEDLAPLLTGFPGESGFLNRHLRNIG